jgi:hypothetical protein
MRRLLPVLCALAALSFGAPQQTPNSTTHKSSKSKPSKARQLPPSTPDETPAPVNPDPNRPHDGPQLAPVRPPKAGKTPVRPADPTAPKPKQPVKDS